MPLTRSRITLTRCSSTPSADTFVKAGANMGAAAAANVHIKAGANLVIEAGAMITLKAGSSSIVLGPTLSITGSMVMINSATGFRRVDLATIALARSFGAITFQVYWKIRIPMALPMVIVGLMVGSIFGLLTAVGAELVGGKDGLGNRLSYYSSLIQMPQFFACIVILALIGVLLYVTFFLIGKKWASWQA